MNAAKGMFLFYCQMVMKLIYLAVSDAVRTSLGPKGMDKMVSSCVSEYGQQLMDRSKQVPEKSSSPTTELPFSSTWLSYIPLLGW
jgi:hypothetical protein